VSTSCCDDKFGNDEGDEAAMICCDDKFDDNKDAQTSCCDDKFHDNNDGDLSTTPDESESLSSPNSSMRYVMFEEEPDKISDAMLARNSASSAESIC